MIGRVPAVSVIIPTYRRRRYLIGAVKSALAQSYHDFEIIVTDNDGEGRLPSELIDLNDPRLRYRRNPTNLGMLRNLLAAVQETRGRYVATLHDDDQWEPEFLENLVPYLEADSDITVAFADHYLMDERGHVDPAITDASTHRWRRDRLASGRHEYLAEMALLDGSIPIVVGAVFRKSAIAWDCFPEEVSLAYDLWLAYLAVRSGGAACYHPARLARYRIHSGAETQGNRIGHEVAAAFCYQRFTRDDTLRPLRRRFEARYASHTVSAATALLRAGLTRQARSHLLNALRRHPTPRAVAALVVSLLPSATARTVTSGLVILRHTITSAMSIHQLHRGRVRP